MNHAVVIAGGTGRRMGQDIPKQFINIYDRPVIVYTLLGFQSHSQIDDITVVCLEGWHDVLKAYCRQFNIDKLVDVVPSGESCQESIRNGVYSLDDRASDGDLVIIHDGVRPLMDHSVLTDVLEVASRYGNAVTSMPYNEQIFVVTDEDSSTTNRFIPRDNLRRVSTPQAYEWSLLRQSYERAFAEGVGIAGSNYTNTMMVQLGETLHLAKGSDRNIKLTTRDDLEMFKAYLNQEEYSWLK